MSTNEKRVTRDKITLGFSIAIIIGEIVGLVMCTRNIGWELFRYYTQDSNLFLLIATVIWSACVARRLRDGVPVPCWVRVLKYMATCTVALTLTVVMAVLAPMGVDSMRNLLFSGSMLWCHTLCPILAIVASVFFDTMPDLQIRDTAVALIPTVLYGIVSVLLNVLQIWYGPYPFLYVYEQPIWVSLVWIVVIVGGAWFLSFLLYCGNRVATREYVYH